MNHFSWHPIRSPLVTFHLLEEENGLTLIDTGFVGGVRLLKQTLDRIDRDLSEIDTILLSHGHLDHTLNAHSLQQLTGARLLAPRLDRLHIEGQYPYRGLSRITGFGEMMGRSCLRYQAPQIDEWFGVGDHLPICGGLEVIDLSGHTHGHCGFYAPSQKHLFANDLFTNDFGFPMLPPPWFNLDREKVITSIHRAAALELEGLSLNHSRPFSPKRQLENLAQLAKKYPLLP